jgi:hypothetical protein
MSEDRVSADVEESIVSLKRSKGWRLWLRAVEVRLRFVVLVLLMLFVTTQWEHLRGTWDDWVQRLWGRQSSQTVSGDREYFCPMDPGVITAWPSICPICNMDLVQREKHDAQILPEGVIARMQISPYRVQLAGIRTAEVQTRELEMQIPFVGDLQQPVDDESAAIELVATISQADRPLLTRTCRASLAPVEAPSDIVELNAEPVEGADETSLRFRLSRDQESLPEWMQPGRLVRGRFKMAPAPIQIEGQPAAPLAIPESALVDHGSRQLVFVESMPGTFDAREVTVGPRHGDFYPVLSGLSAGEQIAEAGAFLIDAETRLNPSLAVAYFGANQAGATGRAPTIRVAQEKSAPTLSEEDLLLVEEQKRCPVTKLDLNAMGGPIPVDLPDRRVFVCCKGCIETLKKNPQKYLAKTPEK